MISTPFSVAILPFLKTSGSILLGGVRFRSTDDLAGLPEAEAAAVADISKMLFSNDDMRIKNASYAIVPGIDVNHGRVDATELENIQALLAYLYSSPHRVFETVFLTSEHASLALFTPSDVPVLLLRSSHNLVQTTELPYEPDERGFVRGYAGLYNFRHHFWVAKGSRVYGPLPHPILNVAQDLQRDVTTASSNLRYELLFRLLDRPQTPIAIRVITALRWYNSAHSKGADELAALVHLAIAFEALLGLPQSEKTDRLVDAIALLLGRVPRLDIWAQQFYVARSQIVHEGNAETLRFFTLDDRRKVAGQSYQSLMSYGTQVFRLCLGTLLVGADLAEQAGLEERLVTNEERYAKLCRVFSDVALPPLDRMTRATEVVDAIELYQFVRESGLQLESMLGAIRAGARTLIESGVPLGESEHSALTTIIHVPRSLDHFEELDALSILAQSLPDKPLTTGAEDTVRRLVKAVWMTVFTHYYWMRDRRKGLPDAAVTTPPTATP
jgi:hypothetical protein